MSTKTENVKSRIYDRAVGLDCTGGPNEVDGQIETHTHTHTHTLNRLFVTGHIETRNKSAPSILRRVLGCCCFFRN